jgi:hypothetical protein
MAERLQKYEIGKKFFLFFRFSYLLTCFDFLWQNEVGAALAEAGEYILQVFPIYFLKSVICLCMEVFEGHVSSFSHNITMVENLVGEFCHPELFVCSSKKAC